MSWISDIARPEIVALKAYEHASWEPHLERLHANELPWRSAGDDTNAGLNRYPEPQPRELVARLAALYGARPDQVLVGRGSDEAIDLLCRAAALARRRATGPPTFGMHASRHASRVRMLSVCCCANDGSLTKTKCCASARRT
jgi:histidinol-phosphate/aromatic aminotransferase/cobyric acid decarboxylase-like protein